MQKKNIVMIDLIDKILYTINWRFNYEQTVFTV